MDNNVYFDSNRPNRPKVLFNKLEHFDHHNSPCDPKEFYYIIKKNYNQSLTIENNTKIGDADRLRYLLYKKIQTREEDLERSEKVFTEFSNSFKNLNNYIQQSFNRCREAINHKEKLFINEIDDSFKEANKLYKEDKVSLKDKI